MTRLLLPVLFALVLVLPTAEAREALRIVYLTDESHADGFAGVKTAIREGKRPASAAGLDLSAERVIVSPAEGAETLLRERIGAGERFFVLALPPDAISQAAALPGAEETVLMNVASGEQSLRGSRCAENLFHVAPSEAMAAEARATADAPQGTPVATWSGSEHKFAADQLKSRFEKTAGRPMTPADWQAWFAADAITEAAIARRSAEPEAIRAHLTDPSVRFHNYKGAASRFRESDRQLVQPLYVTAPDGAVRRVAEATGADGEACAPTQSERRLSDGQ